MTPDQLTKLLNDMQTGSAECLAVWCQRLLDELQAPLQDYERVYARLSGIIVYGDEPDRESAKEILRIVEGWNRG